MNKITCLLPAVLFCLPVFLASCTRDDDPCDGHPSKTETYYVSAQTKSKSPYSGYEVLTFISNMGDTAVFTGQGKKTSFYSTSDYSSGNPACGNLDYWYMENIEYTFIGTHPAFKKYRYVLIGGYPGAYVTPGSDNDFIGLDIYTFNNNTISGTAVADHINDSLMYKDSIIVANNTIKAFRFVNDIVYSKKYGMIRFTDTLSKKIWTIKLP